MCKVSLPRSSVMELSTWCKTFELFVKSTQPLWVILYKHPYTLHALFQLLELATLPKGTYNSLSRKENLVDVQERLFAWLRNNPPLEILW